MSRIQDILAKAERDGTTRRTPAPPTLVPPPAQSPVVAPPLDAGPARHHSPFGSAAAPALATFATDPRQAPSTPLAEPRTGHATLHPALVAAIEPQSAIADQYRAIRARLSAREDAGALRTILVTSPGPQDGKSITAANLALTMAQEHQRSVLLVDCNLRDAAVHALFGVDDGPGLSDVVTGDATIDEALLYLPEHKLTLLTAGAVPPYPTELLGSTAMRRAMDVLRSRFDRIVVDLPAVAPLADAGTLAPLADGVLLVVRAGVTQRPALEEALAVFDEDKVAGVVLNDTV